LDSEIVRLGLAGTGFVARHLALELRHRPDWRLGAVLTRRDPASLSDFPAAGLVTGSVEALLERSDIVLECSGDVLRATELVEAALAVGKPVVTYAPEFHVTAGSAYVGRGLLTEAEGDQPGSLAALVEEARSMGFAPLVLGNMKGFLDTAPTPEAMRHWAARQGLSLPMVTSFTDGTKLQVEQCLVGNHFGADIAQEGLLGPACGDLAAGAQILARAAQAAGGPITDYLLSRDLPHGVFLVARHRSEQQAALRYLKMGDGPFYTLVKPAILVHLEAFKTLERVRRGGGVLLDNGARPRLSVAAVAKRRLAPGERIDNGIGSFALRGICVRIADRPGHLPIGLARDLVVARRIEPGQILELEDVELPPSRALDRWLEVRARVLATPIAA
jgi:predicted homoserine dehydrogenase-like protein